MKKIVHIMMACFYYEGFGYQENILPKKHKELGFDVSIIASQECIFRDGKKQLRETGSYINENGVNVVVLPFARWYGKKTNFQIRLSVFVRKYAGLKKALKMLEPDIIFIHGLQEVDCLDVVGYVKKNPNTKLFVDQHGDYYNSPVNGVFNFIAHKIFFAYIANQLAHHSEKIWGVTPWRVTYLKEVYRLPAHKIDFLPMGGDDSLIHFDAKDQIRNQIREKHHINSSDFLVISGGKIDKTKNIHLLMQAIVELNNPNIKLLIFGIPDAEMKVEFEQLAEQSNQLILAGWISSNDAYDYFLASDLCVFPGTHSVLWEQAVSTGLPCLFKHWNGMEHVNIGGNSILMEEPDNDELLYKKMMKGLVQKLSIKGDDFLLMKHLSETEGIKSFSYLEIAKKAIQLNETI